MPRTQEGNKLLLEIIQKIMNEELVVQEVAIKEVIKFNLKITNKCLDKISSEMAELTRSLDHIQNQFNKELKAVKSDINQSNDCVKELEVYISRYHQLEEKLTEPGEWWRRNNLQINGIVKSLNETWEESESKVWRKFWKQN